MHRAKKKHSGVRLTVRSCNDGSQREMASADFLALLDDKRQGMPFRLLPLNVLISKRVTFLM